MGIFRSDLKRIFTSWIFFLSIVIVVIGGIIQCALIYPDFADHSQTYGPLNCFLAAFCLSGYGPVVAPYWLCYLLRLHISTICKPGM